jgi:hypothetical protein
MSVLVISQFACQFSNYTQSGLSAMSGPSNSIKHVPDDSAGAVSSIPPSITHQPRSMSWLPPADAIEALLNGGEAVVDGRLELSVSENVRPIIFNAFSN